MYLIRCKSQNINQQLLSQMKKTWQKMLKNFLFYIYIYDKSNDEFHEKVIRKNA